MKRLKKVLGRIPFVANTYRQIRFFAKVSYADWRRDPQQEMDEHHLKGTWNFESPIEKERHGRILLLVERYLRAGRWGEVLEMGSSEGAFTAQLALRCRSVLGCDLSAAACVRASHRCSTYPQVSIKQFNLLRDQIPGQFDLVFAMDVLECLRGPKRAREAATKLAKSLKSGGLLVFSGCNSTEAWRRGWLARSIRVGADDLITFFCEGLNLHVVHREPYPGASGSLANYPDHVIVLFEKAAI